MSTLNLVNHFLLAMPNTEDPVFQNSVIYICEHTENGAMGIMVNKPSGIELARLLEQVSIKPDLSSAAHAPVYLGGPVQTDRGFVLHEYSGEWQSTLRISDEISLTSSRDILTAIAQGNGPGKFLVTLGYTSWGAGQLEEEIVANGWLIVPAQKSIIFDSCPEDCYDQAVHILGIDISVLSFQIGHA